MFMHIDCVYFDIRCQKTDFLGEVFSFEFLIEKPKLTQFINIYFKRGKGVIVKKSFIAHYNSSRW